MVKIRRFLEAPLGYQREAQGALGGGSSESRGDSRSIGDNDRGSIGGGGRGGDNRDSRDTQNAATEAEARGSDSTTEDRRSATARRAADAFGTPAHGRFSTPGPIGDAQSYGISQSQFDSISEPHQAASPDRFESWAKDVLARGGPTTEREEARLGEGLSAHRNYQGAQALGGVASLGSPIAGGAIKAAENVYGRFQSPTYQGARALSADASPISGALGTLGGIAGSLAPGSSLAQGISNVNQVAGPAASAFEAGTSPTGDLFGEISKTLGLDRARSAFARPGGDNGNYNTSLQAPAPPTLADSVNSSVYGFQAADPYNYSTFLDNFRTG